MLVAALLVATTNLGFWQLRRLDVRRDHNARVVARADEPVVALATAFGALTEGMSPEDLRHVRVTVSGTWDVASEVYLANRSRDGVPGVHVVTLLRIEGVRPSVGVAVDRGFVPRVHYLKGDRSAWAPAGGEVEVAGSLEVGRMGERGHGSEVDRIDLWRRWGSGRPPTGRRVGRPPHRRRTWATGPTSRTPSSGSYSPSSAWAAIPWSSTGWPVGTRE